MGDNSSFKALMELIERREHAMGEVNQQFGAAIDELNRQLDAALHEIHRHESVFAEMTKHNTLRDQAIAELNEQLVSLRKRSLRIPIPIWRFFGRMARGVGLRK